MGREEDAVDSAEREDESWCLRVHMTSLVRDMLDCVEDAAAHFAHELLLCFWA